MALSHEKIRILLGDPNGETFTGDDLLVAENEPNEYLAAALLLDMHLTRLVLSGAGANIKTDDLSVNNYNNIVVLRQLARDLRTRGDALVEQEKRDAGGVAVYWPEDTSVSQFYTF